MNKVHGGDEDDNETSVAMCKACGLKASSERILANPIKKSHHSIQLNQNSDLDCDQCDKTFISSKGLKMYPSSTRFVLTLCLINFHILYVLLIILITGQEYMKFLKDVKIKTCFVTKVAHIWLSPVMG